MVEKNRRRAHGYITGSHLAAPSPETTAFGARVFAHKEPDAIVSPIDLVEVEVAVAACTLAGLSAVPVGSGTHGGRLPTEPYRLISMRALRGVRIDEVSRLATVEAGATWREVDVAARQVGLTVRHLVDAYPEATVGGTLASAAFMPPLWRARTARSAVIGLRAVRNDGRAYMHVRAPRTASGPDLRALFFEGNGAHGPIVEATVELMPLDRARLSGTIDWSNWRPVRDALVRHNGNIVVGPSADFTTLNIDAWGAHADAKRAIADIRALGFRAVPKKHVGAWHTPPQSSVVLTLPWTLVAAARSATRSKKLAFSIAAAGTTHVAIVASVAASSGSSATSKSGAATALTTALNWATRVQASMPSLIRIANYGTECHTVRHAMVKAPEPSKPTRSRA